MISFLSATRVPTGVSFLFTFLSIVLAIHCSWMMCPLLVFSIIIAILVILDSVGRYFEYRFIKRIFQRKFSKYLIKQMAKSACQRQAVLTAASETGYYQEAYDYFNSLGIKWYHLLPDAIKDPKQFFTKKYWKTFFRFSS